MDNQTSTIKCMDHSEDEEKFEDAPTPKHDNEKIVDDLIEQHKHLLISSDVDTDIEKTIKDLDIDSVPNESDKFVDCNADEAIIDLIDDESQRDFEKTLTDVQKQENRLKSEEMKHEGNTVFKEGDYEKSVELYTNGLRLCPVDCATDRAVLYANRAAAKMKMELNQAAIDDCTKAIEFNPNYVKAYLR